MPCRVNRYINHHIEEEKGSQLILYSFILLIFYFYIFKSMERHPFRPFLPEGARLLMLGSFPPSRKRWAMDFYYPNFTNDMWRVMGICFFNDKLHFVKEKEKKYDQEGIMTFLKEKGIAMYDMATCVVRTKNTASDKDLQVVEETDLKEMLNHLPMCRTIITAGQLSTTMACRQFGVEEPAVGESIEFPVESRCIRLYRMPSTSRAYPLPVEQKARIYLTAFRFLFFYSFIFLFL